MRTSQCSHLAKSDQALRAFLSRVIHSRIYNGQFLSSFPFDSQSARSFTTSRSTRITSLTSIAAAQLSCSSEARSMFTSSPLILPLTPKIPILPPPTHLSTLHLLSTYPFYLS